jgi:hypothetical protein
MKPGWTARRLLPWLGALACLFAAFATFAHESRPAYLQVDEIAPNRYTILWRTPNNAGQRLPVILALPDDVHDVSPRTVRELPDSRIEHRIVQSRSGLPGQRIAFVGLQGTITDVLVRVQLLNGEQSTTLVHPSDASVEVPRKRSLAEVARSYIAFGVEHILGGVDHLLFVLGLLLIVHGGKRIVATITAFTVAHSITLAAATRGWVQVPPAPVEAIIALSIVFIAVEIVRGMRGHPGITARAPWLVAFSFGLLHGFGFAGALAEVGLPQQAIPLALLCFNVGVELGQLLFVGVVLTLMAAWRRMPISTPRWLPWVTPYAIGGVAAFWMLQRVGTFWG